MRVNPDTQAVFAADERKTIMGEYSTLAMLDQTFGNGAAAAWLVTLITNLNIFAGSRSMDDHQVRLRKIFKESVISYDLAQNLFIIRTLPGLAPAACSALDSMSLAGMVGTIAGDDTAFIAMRDNDAAKALYEEIRKLL